jgi:hypothetical protein
MTGFGESPCIKFLDILFISSKVILQGQTHNSNMWLLTICHRQCTKPFCQSL